MVCICDHVSTWKPAENRVWTLSCLTFEESVLKMSVSLLENSYGKLRGFEVLAGELGNELVLKKNIS